MSEGGTRPEEGHEEAVARMQDLSDDDDQDTADGVADLCNQGRMEDVKDIPTDARIQQSYTSLISDGYSKQKPSHLEPSSSASPFAASYVHQQHHVHEPLKLDGNIGIEAPVTAADAPGPGQLSSQGKEEDLKQELSKKRQRQDSEEADTERHWEGRTKNQKNDNDCEKGVSSFCLEPTSMHRGGAKQEERDGKDSKDLGEADGMKEQEIGRRRVRRRKEGSEETGARKRRRQEHLPDNESKEEEAGEKKRDEADPLGCWLGRAEELLEQAQQKYEAELSAGANVVLEDAEQMATQEEEVEQLMAQQVDKPVDRPADHGTEGVHLQLLIDLLAQQNLQDSKDKDLVILLGVTDAGKSTTINYLAGKKIKEVVEDATLQPGGTPGRRRRPGQLQDSLSTPHKARIVAEEELTGFKIGASAVHSQTRSFNVYDCKDLPFSLCDSPGFEDSEGDTYDIAMAAGLRSLLLNSRSARFLLLFDGHSHAGKGRLIKTPVRILSKLFDDLDVPLKSFAFFVTKVQPGAGVPNGFWDVLEGIAESDTSTENEKQFVERIYEFGLVVEKTELKEITLDPLAIQPHVYCKMIEDLPPLSCDKYQLNLPLTSSQRNILEHECLSSEIDLKEDLNLHQYFSASLHYRKIESLAVGLKLKDLMETQENCKRLIREHVTSLLEQSTTARDDLDYGNVVKLLNQWRKLTAVEIFKQLVDAPDLLDLTCGWLVQCKDDIEDTIRNFANDANHTWCQEQEKAKVKVPVKLFQDAASIILKKVDAIKRVEEYLAKSSCVSHVAQSYNYVHPSCRDKLQVFHADMRRLGECAIEALIPNRQEHAAKGCQDEMILLPQLPLPPIAPIATLERCLQILDHEASLLAKVEIKTNEKDFRQLLFQSLLRHTEALVAAAQKLKNHQDYTPVPALQLLSQLQSVTALEHPRLHALLQQSHVEGITLTLRKALHLYSNNLSERITRAWSRAEGQQPANISEMLALLQRYFLIGASYPDSYSCEVQNLVVSGVASRISSSVQCVQEAELHLENAFQGTIVPLAITATDISLALEDIQAVSSSAIIDTQYKKKVQRMVEATSSCFEKYSERIIGMLRKLVHDSECCESTTSLTQHLTFFSAFGCLAKADQTVYSRVCQLLDVMNQKLGSLIREQSNQPHQLLLALHMYAAVTRLADTVPRTHLATTNFKSMFDHWNRYLQQQGECKAKNFGDGNLGAKLHAVKWMKELSSVYQAQLDLGLPPVSLSEGDPKATWASLCSKLEEQLVEHSSLALLDSNLARLKEAIESLECASRCQQHWYNPPDFKTRATNLKAKYELAKVESKNAFQQYLQNPSKYEAAMSTLQSLQSVDEGEYNKLCWEVVKHFRALIKQVQEKVSGTVAPPDLSSTPLIKTFFAKAADIMANGRRKSSFVKQRKNLNALKKATRFGDDVFLDYMCSAIIPAAARMCVFLPVLPETYKQDVLKIQQEAVGEKQNLVERLELQVLLQLTLLDFRAADRSWRMLGRIASSEQKCESNSTAENAFTTNKISALLQRCIQECFEKSVLKDLTAGLKKDPEAILRYALVDSSSPQKSRGLARALQVALQSCQEAACLVFTDTELDLHNLEQQLQLDLSGFSTRGEENVRNLIACGSFDEATSFVANLRAFIAVITSLKNQAERLAGLSLLDEEIHKARETLLNVDEGINQDQMRYIEGSLSRCRRMHSHGSKKLVEKLGSWLSKVHEILRGFVTSPTDNLENKQEWFSQQAEYLSEGATWRERQLPFETILNCLINTLESELDQAFTRHDSKRREALLGLLECSGLNKVSAVSKLAKKALTKSKRRLQRLDEATAFFNRLSLLDGPLVESKIASKAACLHEVQGRMKQVFHHLTGAIRSSGVTEKVTELMRLRAYKDIVTIMDNLKVLGKSTHLQELHHVLQEKVEEIKQRMRSRQEEKFRQAQANFKARLFGPMDKCWDELESMKEYSREFGLPRESALLDLLAMVQRHVDEENKSFATHNLSSLDKADQAERYSIYLCDLWSIHKDCQNPDIQRHIFQVGSTTLIGLLGDGLGDLNMMFMLGSKLELTDIGREVANAFPQFQAMLIRRRNEITRSIGISLDGALEEWKGLTDSEKDSLRQLYRLYDEKYGSYKDKYMGLSRHTAVDLQLLIKETQSIASRLLRKGSIKDMTEVRSAIPDLLARVVTTWSVLSSLDSFQKTGNEDDIVNPHVIQVLTIFRLFGLDQPTKDPLKRAAHWVSKRVGISAFEELMKKHLAQIVTGGGKSITLGFVSSILALLNCKVYYACYSQYLSERDRKAFEPLWNAYGIYEQINCSTLPRMVDALLEETADVRSLTALFLKDPKGYQPPQKAQELKEMPKVLLIDEVDVFLSDSFFSSTVIPAERLSHDSFYEFMHHVWSHRQEQAELTRDRLLENKHLQTFLGVYPGAAHIIDSHLENLLAALPKFKEPQYSLTKTKKGLVLIGYNKFGTVHTEVTFGYRTQWAYFHELEQGKLVDGVKLSEQTVKQRVGMNVCCGAWSYSESPKKDFDCILGVTGTLEWMSKYEKEIVGKEYSISAQTITPSIFGECRLKLGMLGADGRYGPAVIVETSLCRQYLTIREHVKHVINTSNKHRAVYIFFSDEEAMVQFQNSDDCVKYLASEYNVVSVTAADIRKQAKFDNASRPTTVTLLPRVFGRGVDFKSFSQALDDAGGVHVIQTFYSDAESEEIQIKGRTARMGKQGSYELILNAQDLHKSFHIEPSVWDQKQTPEEISAVLKRARDQCVDGLVEEMKSKGTVSLEYHRKSERWFRSLLDGKPDVTLLQEFQEMGSGKAPTHWVFVVDISGSMGQGDIVPESSGWTKCRLGCVMEKVDAFMEAKRKSTKDRFSLITFNKCATVVLKQVSPDDEIARLQLHLVNADGGTSFANALKKTEQMLKDCWTSKQSVKILFLSDGEDKQADSHVNAIMQAGKDQYADVCIWTVKFSADKGGSSVLKRIAELGGGEYREALSSTEFRSALSDFASEVLERDTTHPSSSSSSSASLSSSATSSYRHQFVHAPFKIGDEVKLRALTKHFKHKYNGKIAFVEEYIQEKDQVRVKVSEGGEELTVKVQNLEAQESDKENDTSFDSSSTSSSCRDLLADVPEAEEAEALPIKVGDAVKLHSLGRRKQKHNGKTGVVQAYIKEKDVFRVKLREGTEVLTVKPHNLEAGRCT